LTEECIARTTITNEAIKRGISLKEALFLLESSLEGQQSYVLAMSQHVIAENLFKEARTKNITITSKQQRVIDLTAAFDGVYTEEDCSAFTLDQMISKIAGEEDQLTQAKFTSDVNNDCRKLLRVADFLATKKEAKLAPGSSATKKAAVGAKGEVVDDDPDADYLRLRGLPFQASPAQISEFLGAGTTADDIFISLNHSGRPTGSAFVKVIGEENFTLAMGKNRGTLLTRYVEVFESNLKEFSAAMQRRQHLISKRDEIVASTNVWGSKDSQFAGCLRLRGLPFAARDDDVLAFFEGIPLEKEGVTICTHPMNGRNNGEGFVEFNDEASVVPALERNRNEIQGRYIELFACTKGEILAHLANKASAPGRPTEMASKEFESLAQYGASTAMLVARLRGLPFQTTTDEVREFFADLNLTIPDDGIHFRMNHEGRPSGEGFVHFANEADAKACLVKNREHIGTRY
jgi:hypothetical protein